MDQDVPNDPNADIDDRTKTNVWATNSKKKSLIRKRPVSFGVSRNCHGTVFTTPNRNCDSAEYEENRLVALIGVPPQHVPEGILNLFRSHRPFVEHVRVVISDESENDEKQTELGELDTDPSRQTGDRTYLVLVKLIKEEDAISFIDDLDGTPYIAFDDRDKCNIERVVRLQTANNEEHEKDFEQQMRSPFSLEILGDFTNAPDIKPEAANSNTTQKQKQQLITSSMATTVSEDYQNCAVCLEDLNEKPSLLTTVCNHTFHLDCLQKCTGPCPVCRYDHSGLNETLSQCHMCGTTEHNYVCLICGVISCGVPLAAASGSSGTGGNRFYTSSHAGQHYRKTLHAYALDTRTQHVYDFCGGGYVHRLVQNKEDGKLVEVSTTGNSFLSDSQEGEVVHRKLEGAAERYNSLLKSQLEQQRCCYEERLASIKSKFDDTSQQPSSSKENLMSCLKQEKKQVQQRLTALQRKKSRVLEDASFLKSMNESLQENQPLLKHRIQQAGRERNESLEMISQYLPKLEEKLASLMQQLERSP